MAVLLVFSFLGGIITVLSPCILPILPVVLSGSMGRGRARPLGIVSGFVASFTAFTLTLTLIVQATSIPPDALRYVAVAIILGFGIVMVVPKLHEWFGIQASRLAGLVRVKTAKGADGVIPKGFVSGFVMGLGLGLVWTPCVGPIMASVMSLALTQKLDGGAVLITLAYTIGTSIPMLGIMLGGRALLAKVPALVRNTARIQKVFGVVMVLTGVSIALGWDRAAQAAILNVFPSYGSGLTTIENIEPVKEALELRDNAGSSGSGGDVVLTAENMLGDYGPAPEITTRGRWYNTEGFKEAVPSMSKDSTPALSMESLRGKVVLIDFWTYSCINCVRTLPHLAAWDKAYRDSGLVIIGVHTPEFEFEKNPAHVKKAIADLGVTWPVVLDNDYAQWNAYDNRYWPAHYFIDSRGRIRYYHFGEGKYDESERVIKALLKETGVNVMADAIIPEKRIESETPETYLGYARARGFASAVKPVADEAVSYEPAKSPGVGEWNLNGTWIVSREYVTPSPEGTLSLGFHARIVYLVAESVSQTGRIEVLVDGKIADDTEDVKDGILTPRASKLYKIVSLPSSGKHVLSLAVSGGLRLYSFTFG